MTLKIHVEDSRIGFLVELLESLSFVTIDTDSESLSDEEKKFIESRLAHHEAHRDKAISWDNLKKQLLETSEHGR